MDLSGLRVQVGLYVAWHRAEISDGVLEKGLKRQRSVRDSDKLATHVLGG